MVKSELGKYKRIQAGLLLATVALLAYAILGPKETVDCTDENGHSLYCYVSDRNPLSLQITNLAPSTVGIKQQVNIRVGHRTADDSPVFRLPEGWTGSIEKSPGSTVFHFDLVPKQLISSGEETLSVQDRDGHEALSLSVFVRYQPEFNCVPESELIKDNLASASSATHKFAVAKQRGESDIAQFLGFPRYLTGSYRKTDFGAEVTYHLLPHFYGNIQESLNFKTRIGNTYSYFPQVRVSGPLSAQGDLSVPTYSPRKIASIDVQSMTPVHKQAISVQIFNKGTKNPGGPDFQVTWLSFDRFRITLKPKNHSKFDSGHLEVKDSETQDILLIPYALFWAK